MKINLLPWRKTKKILEKKILLSFGSVMLFMGLAIFFIRFVQLNFEIDRLQTNNQQLVETYQKRKLLKKEIEIQEKKNNQLTIKLGLLKSLEGRADEVPVLLDSIVRLMPKGMTFQKIKRKKDHIYLEGNASSAGKISQYLKALQKEAWVENPELSRFQLQEGAEKNTFLLNFSLNRQGLNR